MYMQTILIAAGSIVNTKSYCIVFVYTCALISFLNHVPTSPLLYKNKRLKH